MAETKQKTYDPLGQMRPTNSNTLPEDQLHKAFDSSREVIEVLRGLIKTLWQVNDSLKDLHFEVRRWNDAGERFSQQG